MLTRPSTLLISLALATAVAKAQSQSQAPDRVPSPAPEQLTRPSNLDPTQEGGLAVTASKGLPGWVDRR